MKNAFANKISYFILTFIFLIITASFLFSNFDNFSMGSAQQVATVDGTPITTREYSTALNRQVEFFNQMMGGKGMSQKQLEQMGIKQSVLNGLIQQKLILNAADQFGIIVSLEEVKQEIKNMQYFKTKNQFDVNLYRNMLQSNGYTPNQFEELVANDLKQKKIDELFNSVMISDKFLEDVTEFKSNEVSVQGIKISRQALSPLISITEQEIKDYIAQSDNQKILESSYKENESRYNKPAQIKARHILIQGQDDKALEKIKSIKAKVSVKNFKDVAKKETQDPSGKNNGGDLGWFEKGKMVPEFDKVAFNLKKGEISEPVKTQFGYHLIYLENKKDAKSRAFDSVKEELARIEIQKTKGQDLDKLLANTDKELTQALQKNDFTALQTISKKVDAQLFNNSKINQFDQSLSGTTLSPKETEQIFQSKSGSILSFGNAGTIFLIKVTGKHVSPQRTPEELKGELGSQTQTFSRRVREELMRSLNNKAKIVTNQSLL